MTRETLILDLNTAYAEGRDAAEANRGWETNPHSIGSPLWSMWCSGYKHTLEDLARKEARS